MKKILSFILCLILGLTLISCSSKSDEKTEGSKSEEITDTTKDSTSKQEAEKSDTAEKQKTQNQGNSTAAEDKKSNLITLSTYTADEQTLSVKTLSTIQVEESLSLEEKLTKLANELSIKGFQGLPIKVVRVETYNGVKKATINLEDLNSNPTIGWNKTYFQGSTMGSITTKSLIETFKQKSLPSEWIGYVEFLYNNNPIESDHASDLTNTIKLK